MVYFSTKDPRGFIISCSVECWNNHLNSHPEIEGYENEAKKAIEDPSYGCIFLSKHKPSNHDPDRYIYYRKIKGRAAEIRVVVQFDDNNVGTVHSVCFASNRPKGELLIWPG